MLFRSIYVIFKPSPAQTLNDCLWYYLNSHSHHLTDNFVSVFGTHCAMKSKHEIGLPSPIPREPQLAPFLRSLCGYLLREFLFCASNRSTRFISPRPWYFKNWKCLIFSCFFPSFFKYDDVSSHKKTTTTTKTKNKQKLKAYPTSRAKTYEK
jgi:hypothetical protein